MRFCPHIGFSVDYTLHMATAFATPSASAVALAAGSRIGSSGGGSGGGNERSSEGGGSDSIDSTGGTGSGSEGGIGNGRGETPAAACGVRPGDVAAWRAAESLVELWPSIQGAALTPCVAAASLLGCTIQIFVKMGATLLGCTLLSALFALLVLPGLLLCCAQRDAQPPKPPRPATARPSSRRSRRSSRAVEAKDEAHGASGGEAAAEGRAELGQAPSVAGAADAPGLAASRGSARVADAETAATHGARPRSGFLSSRNRSPHRSSNSSSSSISSNGWALPALRSDRPSLDQPMPAAVR